MEHNQPMSSSPPPYDDYTPSGSQDRSDREHSLEDHARKRRRIDNDNTHARNMTDPSRPPANPRRTAFPGQYDFDLQPYRLPPVMPLDLPVGTFLEEDAALEYLASGSGFAQDLQGLDFAGPSHVPPFVAQTQSTQPVALTSHPSQPPIRERSAYPPFRHLPDDFFIPPRAAVARERGRDGDHVVAESSTRVSGLGPSFDFSAPPAYRPPVYPAHIQVIQGISPPRRTPTVPSTPPSEAPKKSTTMLVLSRASEESIEALDEHKRECPTCCLEFEPDNFVAVITCCDMAMHVRCLSAWLNSQSYSKSRACMKCRRPIDAKYMLNKVVPPITDKEWDEGGDFNAPESLKPDAKIELNVTGRPHRSRSGRNSMGYGGHRGGRHGSLMPHLTSEQRLAMLRLQEDHLNSIHALRNRSQADMENSNRTNHEDLDANRALVEAQTSATEGELTALLKRCQETRAARQAARDSYEKTRMDMEAMERSYGRRLAELLEEFQSERDARDREARSANEVGETSRSATSAPIPIPQLRVVNGDPSSSMSP